MSNSTNSTNVAVVAVGASFGSIIVTCCCWILICGGCFKAKKWYNKRKKRRFDYDPLQPVNAVPVQAAMPVQAVPVQPAMPVIIPQVQATAIDEDVKLRQFFRDSGIKYFPASKLDLLHLDLVASLFKNNNMPISQVYYSGGVYVIARGNAYSLDSMFKSPVTLVDNIFANPFKITKQSSAIYDLKDILRIYDLYKESDITG